MHEIILNTTEVTGSVMTRIVKLARPPVLELKKGDFTIDGPA